MRTIWLLLFPAITASSGAMAGGLRAYCPERPGLGTPACTIDAGHVSIETGLAGWTRDSAGATRTDTLLLGDTLVRIGLGDTIEAQIGLTPLGLVDVRDRATGAASRRWRAGDLTLGLKANLASPDGSGASLALLPTLSVPVGRRPIGAGDWGWGLRVPASYELSPALSLALTPEVDAAVDADGAGRHLAYGGVAGIGAQLSEAVSAAFEVSAIRDRDPAGHSTQWLASASLGWQPRDDLQFDIGADAGLNRDTPDVTVSVGVSRRF
jgi:hypothetical protein